MLLFPEEKDRKERKNQEFVSENTSHRKEQRERTLQLYTKGQETLTLNFRKKAKWLSHIARSSEPLPSPGWHSTLKYTFFLVSGPPGLIEEKGFHQKQSGSSTGHKEPVQTKRHLRGRRLASAEDFCGGHQRDTRVLAVWWLQSMVFWMEVTNTRFSTTLENIKKICRYCLVNRADTLYGYWGHSTLQTK